MKNNNIFLVIFFAFLCGCVNLRLDISDSDKAWLPYKTNELYELREDVFLMKVDSGLEPERLALVPPSDSRRGSGFYSSPKSIQLYYENPEQASRKRIGDSYYEIDVVGVVSAGTEFIPHKIMRNAGWNLWFGNHTSDSKYAKITTGSHSGKIVDIEDISWCLKENSHLNRYVKSKTSANHRVE